MRLKTVQHQMAFVIKCMTSSDWLLTVGICYKGVNDYEVVFVTQRHGWRGRDTIVGVLLVLKATRHLGSSGLWGRDAHSSRTCLSFSLSLAVVLLQGWTIL